MEHLETADDAGIANHETRWARKLAELKAFVAASGRLPRRTLDGELTATAEQVLFNWLRRQRKAEDRMSELRREELATVPGFTWAPRDDTWAARGEELAAFTKEHGRAPRRRSHSAKERSLAEWLARQLASARAERLAHWRVSQIRDLT